MSDKIFLEKDPTLGTWIKQHGLKALGLYDGKLDNWAGPATEDAEEAAVLMAKDLLSKQEIAPKPDADDTLPNLHRDISARGRDLIMHFESSGPIRIGTPNEKFLRAYQDGGGVWTIGYGHTGLTHEDGTVRKGRVITLAQAEALFAYDMDFFEGRVQKLVKVPLNDDQFAALVAFDFNTGQLHNSTLLRLLNQGNYKAAADQFKRWDYDNGKKIAGLTRRRKSEENLFLGKADPIVR